MKNELFIYFFTMNLKSILLAVSLIAGVGAATEAYSEPLSAENPANDFDDYLDLGQGAFNRCEYDSVKVFTDLAIAYTDNQEQKNIASDLLRKAVTCKTKRSEGDGYMCRLLYGEAFKCFEEVISLNRNDNYCRQKYSSCFKYMHRNKAKDFNMVDIPAGSFTMGRNDGGFDEGPAHKVFCEHFLMCKYEVSVADFVVFLNSCGNETRYGCRCADIGNPYCHIRKVGELYVSEAGYERYPMTCVSYFGAQAYAEWAGLQLMTEEQFEYAFANSTKADSPDGMIPANAGVPNKFGVHNLNGNVSEWTRDCYNPTKYKKSSREGVGYFENFTVRGGSYDSNADINPKTYRDNNPGETFLVNLGFRCVLDY